MGKLKRLKDAVDAARKTITVYHGTPHKFPSERLVQMADGSQQWITGGVDKLPEIPEGAVVVRDAPLGRMRLDKIGTGEGAQAYGHGGYAAESKGTAQWYRDNLTDYRISLDGKALDPIRSGKSRLLEEFGYLGDKEAEILNDVIVSAYNDPQKAGVQGVRKNAEEVLKFYEDAAKKSEPKIAAMAMEKAKSQREKIALIDKFGGRLEDSKGALYTAEIPDADYLLWDKPLSEQPEGVRNALEPYAMALASERDARREALNSSSPGRLSHPVIGKYANRKIIADDVKAGDAYEAMSRAIGSSDAASGALRQAGIPGIKYLDGSSRSAGEGAYNYVLFDPDNDLNILERGKIDPRLLAPIAAGAGALMAAQTYDFGTPEYDAKIQEFRNRRAAKSQIWKELKEAGATIASAIPASIVSDAYRIGGYLSPVTSLEETEQGAESVQNALMYTPEGDNRYLNEFARQVQQFEKDVQPMVNAWKQTPIYKGYKQLPERAQRLIQTASEYAF